MANANDTRDTLAPANQIEEAPRQLWYTQLASATEAATEAATDLPPGSLERRTVFDEQGQPTDLRIITLEEAEANAKAAQLKERRQQRKYPERTHIRKTKPERFLKVVARPVYPNDVPLISLCGKWLAQAGFEMAMRVRVQVEHGRLTITPEVANE
jgi:hypothetical protein